MKMFLVTTFIVAMSTGCMKPTAMSVCEKIMEEKIGMNCRETESGGLATASKSLVSVDLVNVSGKSGYVMSFSSTQDYDKTVENYSKFAGLAGPHRYGNRDKLIFVQLNNGLSQEEGKKVKKIVDEL